MNTGGGGGRAGETGVCDGCGADLRNLALDDGRCPGCGEPVLPVDPREVTQDTEGLALAGRIGIGPVRIKGVVVYAPLEVR